MNEQLVKTEGLNRRAALGLLVLLLACALALMGMRPFHRPDPYVRSVLTRPGNVVQGHAIFQMNCSGCHGLMADGKVGPSLKGVSGHKSRQALIEQVISGNTPPMPQFQPSPQEMADLLSYLESL
ncbi:cytochrome c [Alkalinema sp. FACHB-956]|uniref:c-type cytochrome n=1 Tax=Alkalinema sp. FACHB-956 TaxID=2692768 RepID=UPI0016873C84|nr:cytochrome c [Alkalinema sp. FACHB-956]MBD2326638.1 cytochrome c [Alkalinema sp. FACHB-956]